MNDDGFALFLRRIGRTPLLTAAEERALAYRCERGDLAAHLRHGQGARAYRGAVDDNGTGAALTQTATETRAVQPQIVSQHIEQRSGGFGIHLVGGAIDVQFHAIPRRCGVKQFKDRKVRLL